MIEEVSAAVLFIASILKTSQKVSNEVISKFIVQLYQDLEARFQDHWFEQYPERGSAYRCIRNTSRGGLDPRICKAGSACGISKCALTEILPNEFILWIDPQEISYRVGEYGCLSRVTREEMNKVHNRLKGVDTSCISTKLSGGGGGGSPAKKASRSSPITIKSVEDSSSDQVKLISVGDMIAKRKENEKEKIDESNVESEEHKENSEPRASSPSDNILNFVAEDHLSVTTSIFDQSMSLFDNKNIMLNAANEFEQAYRLSEAAMSSAATWNQLNLLANFWPQSQTSTTGNGFNDYLASQAFNNPSNMSSAIYALN